MAKARAIAKRLKAIRNIRKITRTMELIATARFKKAMDRATEAAAYTRKLAEIVADLSQGAQSISHPLLQPRDKAENSVLLVLSSNRGFNGGYNSGVMRQSLPRIREAGQTGENLQLEVSGKRAQAFLTFQGMAIDRKYMQFEDKTRFEDVEELADRYIQDYISGRLDRLDVAYTRFASVSRQTAVIETLLPIGQLSVESAAKAAHVAEEPARQVEYEFLPSARAILEEIVPASFKARLFKCFLDAIVSDQIFRMVAMKAATENASDMISTLSKQYNRARQTQITSELSEIIGGVAALE